MAEKEGTELQQRHYLQEKTTLAIKNGHMCEFNGKVIGTKFNTRLSIDPLIEELAYLKDWDNQNIHTGQEIVHQLAAPTPTPQRMTISEIWAHASNSVQPFYCILKAMTQQIKSKSFCYQACPTQVNGKPCKKRLDETEEVTWYSSKCNMTLSECNYRYILQKHLQDHKDTIWAIAFDEGATELMDMPVETLYMLQFDDNAEKSTIEVIKNVTYNQFLLNLTCKNETYNNEERLKVTITKAKQLDFASESSDAALPKDFGNWRIISKPVFTVTVFIQLKSNGAAMEAGDTISLGASLTGNQTIISN
ncbi:replication protein A 70 kDa DNA-binding subunit A-like [Cryptomeria japonica]|uniref:replication protein A 70 kDa DNA-binding subunit A-like n=1 Tax=Cryptomeria japonica TaxID=3369 RepID=UPI0027DA5E68|nr:replication protein A 70 kDa DNA-binding subunit A-like [Cryptomeria japonica]